MQVCKSAAQLRQLVRDWKQHGEQVGFVPTMGNLHEGHLSLVRLAAQQADRLVVSIFVNPMQFNNPDDLDNYPRTFDTDQAMLKAESVDAIFYPDVATMYPSGMEHTARIDIPHFFNDLEGEHRPGHFSGVATVVCKLFNLVQPAVTVFGKKDYQQWLLVQKMVADLNMPITVLAGETKRESHGLAMSSRNNLLSKAQRQLAGQLYQVLQNCKKELKNKTPCQLVESNGVKLLQEAGLNVEYLAVREQGSLNQPTDRSNKLVILVAAKVGTVRLIDNLEVVVD